MSRADNSVKNRQNLPVSNPIQNLYNVNAHIKVDENMLKFTSYCPETKIRMCLQADNAKK